MGPASGSEEMGAAAAVIAPRKKSNDFEKGRTPTGTPEYSVKFYDTRKPSEQSLELQESLEQDILIRNR